MSNPQDTKFTVVAFFDYAKVQSGCRNTCLINCGALSNIRTNDLCFFFRV